MKRTNPPDPTLLAAIKTIDAATGNARQGLPEPVFLLASRLTPMLNVDLLIHDAAGRCLLTWRDDTFYGPGWHVPGGIIRFKERAADRIAAVAAGELGAQVLADAAPCVVREIFHSERDVRGHFVSMLYACRLLSLPDERRRCGPGGPRHGDWAWHTGAPADLIEQHQVYVREIEGRAADGQRPGSRTS